LFFVVSSYTALCLFHILPLWFLFIMLYKFIEFIATSIFLKKQYNLKALFMFDLIGRFAAVLFYIVPALVYLTFMFSQSAYLFTIKYSTFFIILVTIISSTYRLWSCFQYRINPLSGVDKR
jgi:CDP-diacylglycerol--glycerol-3-phosphate 3-phosphatidyltransferase